MPSTSSLPLDTLGKLVRLFARKNWPFAEDEGELLETFAKMLANLSQEEQGLVLTLTENFVRIPLTDYPTRMREALRAVPDALIDGAPRVHVLPLVAPEDRDKVKSGLAVIYTSLHLVLPKVPAFKRALDAHRLSSSSSSDGLMQAGRPPCVVVFMDDFVGTGETAEAAIQDYAWRHAMDGDQAIVVSLAAMSAGVARLRRFGVDVYAETILGRGVSDNPGVADKDAALDTLDRIEQRLHISRRFRRGYGGSEALITLLRTPNNTLPVYWVQKRKGGQDWPAPFPR